MCVVNARNRSMVVVVAVVVVIVAVVADIIALVLRRFLPATNR